MPIIYAIVTEIFAQILAEQYWQSADRVCSAVMNIGFLYGAEKF
ncbi:hypothetical protein AGMMS49579_23360 [Spirochaetia bacterium]|nr:hypothetical protein AGMMS49579_23360 [Spirochaetia bacterium]